MKGVFSCVDELKAVRRVRPGTDWLTSHLLLALVAIAVFGWPRAASAQAQPRTRDSAPAPAKSETDSDPGALPEPTISAADEPLLSAPPPAPHVLANWQQAVTLLRRDSTSLKNAQARVEYSAGQKEMALAPALPQLNGIGRVGAGAALSQGGVEQVSVAEQALAWNASLTLRVPVVASRAWYDYGTARRTVDAAALNQTAVARQQLGTVAAAIASVVANERLVEVSQNSLLSSLSTLTLTQQRLEFGAGKIVDVLRIKQEVSESKAQVIAAREALLRARETLGAALGSREAYGVSPDMSLDDLASDAARSCTRGTSTESRPDVRLARASVSIAERNTKAIDYSFVPTVDLLSALTYWSDRRVSPGGRQVTWTLGGLITWQIYDGGLRYGMRRTRNADLETARQTLTDTRRDATIEAARAVRAVSVAEANLGVAEESRKNADETSRWTRIAFSNGTVTSLDLVDAARQQRSTEVNYALKEFEVLQAKIAALLALATCQL